MKTNLSVAVIRQYVVATLATGSVCLQAGTLSIDASGIVRMEPPPGRMTELYAAPTPNAKEWELVTEFDHLAQVDTNRTLFYRARVKTEPLSLVRIIETNQTLRGSVDKRFTNVILVVNGVTNQGWAFGSAGGIGTNASGKKMPVTTRMDFSFRQVHVTAPTLGTLTVWDCDGFILTTNIWIGTGPFKPLLPRWYKPLTNTISPASVGLLSEDPQMQINWGLVSHSASDFVAGPDLFSDPCTPSYQSFDSVWDASGWRLETTWTQCRNRHLERCGVTYSAPTGGTGLMFVASDYGTNCNFPDSRGYSARSEVGSYDSNTDDDLLASHFTHTGASKAEMWIGGRLRGSESNYWVVVGMSLETPTERLGGNEVFWGQASSRLVSSIGGAATSHGKIVCQVPPEGVLLDVTPAIKVMSSGWYLYAPTYQIVPAEQ